MPEYLSPGVYVEEFPTGPRPIEGVSTSTPGMVGQTERGPVRPHLVTSFADYQQWFGGLVNDGFVPFAVRGFFENGGQRVFVARVVGAGSTIATLSLPTKSEPLTLHAIGPGHWGNNLVARVGPASRADLAANPPRDCFRLTIQLASDVVEDYDNLTVDPDSPDNMAVIINQHSRLVTIVPGLMSRPLDVEVTASGGTTVTPQAADVLGSHQVPVDERTGLAAIEVIGGVSILLVPDDVNDSTGSITNEVISQCERLKNRFAIVSAPRNLAPGDDIRPPRDISYAAFYYPWIRVLDAKRQDAVLVPPGGHVAGIYARTDIERGVHKAPANEVVRGVVSGEPGSGREPLEFTISKTEQDVLNPRGVNVIRDFRSDGRGIRVWGARTMSSDAQWKYVSIRRFFIFVEESIDEGTQWVVFEPNDENTWALVRRSIANFLTGLWRSGTLIGATQEEAFFVRCDRTTMTQDDIDNGRLICLIGIAVVRPAEFVIFRIGQRTADK